MRLEDIRAIVTGAAGGLGSHFALELVRGGARVAAGDVNAAGLRSLRAEAGSRGLPPPFVAPLDVTDEASVRDFVERAAAALDGINVLINSAGILRDGLIVQRRDTEVRSLTLDQWRKVLDVNLTGPFLMTREAAARMIASGVAEAVIVNLSSLARAGNPGQSNYAASKAGLDAATRTWALELAPYGIRVAGVAPGVTRTPFLGGISEQALGDLVAFTPLRRPAEPAEIWLAIKFILECAFFTGRVLEVDGGASMGHARLVEYPRNEP
jgi:3-oxoacyl-[acyl-carrier protein] reductase